MAITIKGITVPDSTSTSSMWIRYHQQLKTAYGKENAKYLFAETFKRVGNLSLPDNRDFDTYFAKEGINVKSDIDELITTTRDVVDDVTNVMDAAWWIVGILAAAAIVGVANLLLKRPESIAGFAVNRLAAARTASQIRSQQQAAMMAQTSGIKAAEQIEIVPLASSVRRPQNTIIDAEVIEPEIVQPTPNAGYSRPVQRAIAIE